MTITNSTLSGNSAGCGGGISTGSGPRGGCHCNRKQQHYQRQLGGLRRRRYLQWATCCSGSGVTVSNSTISGNSAAEGGGIYNSNNGGGAALDLGSTILKAGTLGENIFNVGGMVTSLWL